MVAHREHVTCTSYELNTSGNKYMTSTCVFFLREFFSSPCICWLSVAGSPYQYTVGKVPSGGTHKVEFGGPGVEKGEVGAKSNFYVIYFLIIGV